MADPSHSVVRALEAELLYTPRHMRKGHLKRLGKLIPDLIPGRFYTYEYVFNRITRFKPDANGATLLTGRGLRRDLGSLLRRMSLSAPLGASDGKATVVPLDAIAAECNVSVSTVRRWGTTGLPLCYYTVNDRCRVLGVRRSALKRFLSERRALLSRAPGKTTEEERGRILARAEALRKAGGIPPANIVRALVEETGRSAATLLRLLRQHERPRLGMRTARSRKNALSESAQEKLIKLYGDGIPVRALARRFGRSTSAIYRMLHRALIEETSALKIKYIPSPEFAGPDAEAICLGEDGLFTYPPEVTKDMPKAPAGLPPYLRELYSIPLLPREQEGILFRKYNYIKYRMAMLQEKIRGTAYRTRLLERFTEWAQAAEQVRRILIRCNLRLVVSIAKRHVGPLANLFELVSEGNMCLMRAVECYDYTRNARLATYATWAVSKHFARIVPENNYRLAAFVTGQDEMLASVGDSRPNPQETRETLAHIRTVIAHAARHLTDRERRIIESHYGTDGRPARTLREIGAVFGLTRERIRQIEVRALLKLRALIAPEAIEGAVV